MHLIAYVSEIADQKNHETIIENIVQTAKTENAKRSITGVLFYHEGHFLQVIEGAEDTLRSLMRNIEADPRHSDISYLIDTKTESRGFRQWNMDSFDLGKDKSINSGVLTELTESFKKNLLPRSDMLVFYYKALLKMKAA